MAARQPKEKGGGGGASARPKGSGASAPAPATALPCPRRPRRGCDRREQGKREGAGAPRANGARGGGPRATARASRAAPVGRTESREEHMKITAISMRMPSGREWRGSSNPPPERTDNLTVGRVAGESIPLPDDGRVHLMAHASLKNRRIGE